MVKLPIKYEDIIDKLKDKIRQARINAVYTVNTQLLAIYWEIGKTVVDQQNSEGWGTKVIDRLSHDLKSEFPDMKGLSSRNIKYMRAFAEAYPYFAESIEAQSKSVEFVQAPLAQMAENINKTITVILVQLEIYQTFY